MGKRLVEDCLTLDLAWMMRLGPLGIGQAGTGKIHWSIDSVNIASAEFRLDLRSPESARLILWYSISTRDEKSCPTRQIISLSALPQHFSGWRWWLHCPVTGERARLLYLPPGGDRFASRKAWNLAYRVERLNRFDRPFEKLFRMQRRIGGRQGLGTGLEKPKGMWQRTFARHAARFAALDFACTEKIAGLIGRA